MLILLASYLALRVTKQIVKAEMFAGLTRVFTNEKAICIGSSDHLQCCMESYELYVGCAADSLLYSLLLSQPGVCNTTA